MSDLFRDYVTSSAFVLTLTRRQCEVLDAIDQGVMPWGFSHAVPAIKALERRGLVLHVYPATPSHITTEPGKLVAQLVRMAGLSHVNLPDKRSA